MRQRHWVRFDAIRALAWLLALVLGLLCATAVVYAAQERYDYDALGRLIRVIDEAGRVTEYVYDPAGNILQVVTGASAQAPSVASTTPSALRRGETKPRRSPLRATIASMRSEIHPIIAWTLAVDEIGHVRLLLS